MSRFLGLLALVLVVALPASAGAATGYRTGAEVNTPPSGSCFSTFFKGSYTLQDGSDPRVGDVFYVSLSATFIDSFDCAADFVASALTLPSGVAPSISATSPVICRRYARNGAQVLFDDRAGRNCPGALAQTADGWSLRPRANPIAPDVGGGAGSYWTLGYPLRENQTYPNLQMLVPVVATRTMSGEALSFLSCAVSTGCVRHGVALTVQAAAPGGSHPSIRLPADVRVSAVGAEMPLSINAAPAQKYKYVTDLSTSATTSSGVYTGNRPCGAASAALWSNTATADGTFQGDTAWLWGRGGEFEDSATSCFLAPDTVHYYRACPTNAAGSALVGVCAESSFRTGIVSTTFQAPQDTPAGRPRSDQMTIASKVIGGHPSGSVQVMARPRGSGGFAFATRVGGATATQSVGQGTADVALAAQTLAGYGSSMFAPWAAYDMRTCYTNVCGTARTVVAGGVYEDVEATDVTASSVTLRGRPSAPWPSGALSFRLGTADPGAELGRDLPAAATAGLAANSSTTAGATTRTLTGLTPATQYWWSVCFDNTAPSQPGVEDCSTVRTFTTAAAAPPPPGGGETGVPVDGSPADRTPAGAGTGTSAGGGGGVVAVADTARPTLRLRLPRSVRRGRKAKLRILAADASGIRKLTVAVGKGRAKHVRAGTVVLRMPSRGRRVVLTIRAVDGAGNARVLRRALKLTG